MGFAHWTGAAALAVTLIAHGAAAQSVDIEKLDGLKPQGAIIGQSGKFLFPLLVQAQDGSIHACARNQIRWRGRNVRFCQGSGALRELNTSATLATQD